MKPARQTWRTLGRVCLGALWLGLILICWQNRDALTPEALAAYSPENPMLAAMLLVALFGVKSLSVVIYSGLLYAASGILFPLPWAVAVNLIGTAVMVSIPYCVGRAAGKSKAEEIVRKYPRAAQLHELRTGNDAWFAFVIRAVGRLPSDVVSLYLGAIGMPYSRYLAGSVLGMLPHTLTFPLMSTGLLRSDSPGFAVGAVAAEILYVACAAGVYALHKKRGRPRDRKGGTA